MIRRTYGDIKTELSQFAASCGLSVDDTRMLRIVNNTIEELMNEGDWPSIIDRLRFKITGCRHLVIPSDYDRMLYCTVDRQPMTMQSPWYEFVGIGPGWWNYWPNANPSLEPGSGPLWNRELIGVLDRDDIAVFNDIPTDQVYYARVYGTVDERVDGVRPDIRILGYDYSNNWIRTQNATTGEWEDGFTVAINGDTSPFWVQSSQDIKEVTAIIKPRTRGNVMLYAATGDQATIEFLATYAPNDTRPYYRRYYIPGLAAYDSSSQNQREYCVTARLRRRYVPIVSDNDFLCITSVPALKSMIQAIYYNEAKDPNAYQMYKANAIDLMKKETKAYIGLQRQKPFISFGETQGVLQTGTYVQ